MRVGAQVVNSKCAVPDFYRLKFYIQASLVISHLIAIVLLFADQKPIIFIAIDTCASAPLT